MKYRQYFFFGAFFVCAGFLGVAQADDYKVYKPVVSEGEFALEANLNYSADHRADRDNYFSQVLGFEYGLTKWWRVELSAELEKENGTADKLTNLKWENVFVPFAPGENWVDVGFYLELEKAARGGDPNNFEAKLLLEKQFGKFDSTLNLGLGREFGPNHVGGVSGSLAFQTKYRMDKMFEPGFEYYANFGNSTDPQPFSGQDHKLGPVISGKISKINYEAGVLFGISREAPDTTVKLNLEYEF